MQEGGASLVELGIPYADPQADGATIQHTNQVAIKGGTSKISHCLNLATLARDIGLTIPVVLMGYYNPFLQFGIDKLCEETKAAGADGFIVVDLLPEEGIELNKCCLKVGLSNIPIIAPNTSVERMHYLTGIASSFIYCVSVTGALRPNCRSPWDLESRLLIWCRM